MLTTLGAASSMKIHQPHLKGQADYSFSRAELKQTVTQSDGRIGPEIMPKSDEVPYQRTSEQSSRFPASFQKPKTLTASITQVHVVTPRREMYLIAWKLTTIQYQKAEAGAHLHNISHQPAQTACFQPALVGTLFSSNPLLLSLYPQGPSRYGSQPERVSLPTPSEYDSWPANTRQPESPLSREREAQ